MSLKHSIAFLLLGMSTLPAIGSPPLYEVEFLDRARLEAPNAWLPSGGEAVSWAFLSSNGRYVSGVITDSTDFFRKVPYRWDRTDDTLEIIGELAGPVFVYGVNDRGDLAGERRDLSTFGVTEVIFWSDETGAVVHPPHSGVLSPRAWSRILNDEGEVLMFDETGFLLWDPREGTQVPIVTADPSILLFDPISLNDLGQVVGGARLTAYTDPVVTRGFVWDEANGMTLLPGGGERDIARAINDDGVIVGETYVAGQGTFGLLWPDADTAPIELRCGEINGNPQYDCAAQWINGSGRVVGGGHYEDGEPLLSYVWDGTHPYAEQELFVDSMTVCSFAAVSDTGEIGAGCTQGDPTGDDYRVGPAILVPVGQDTEAPTASDPLADPNPAPTGSPVVLTAVIDDGASGGSAIVGASYTVDDGAPVAMDPADGGFDGPAEPVAATLPAFDEPGVHDVCVTGTDAAGNVSNEACTLLVVYDPDAGFVTGGGWIDSPAGAYHPNENLAGRATFGFVARYRRRLSVPDGNTEFQFHAGGLNFHSTAYEWLVVTGDGTARFKGEGVLDGANAPDGDPYRFLIWARDDQPDTFRIRIWYEDGGAEVDVYDNGFDSPLGGGSILVHTSPW
ncbi:MAG: hypothetical protein PVF68_08235 [Acidobacteriota bacterium]|jgi:hypothetical protein